jgi:glycosyltransferase involved in cell wall biosynthesis
MSKSVFFVLASNLETYRFAFVEALFMGLPVIASRNGSDEDFINEENGVLLHLMINQALKMLYHICTIMVIRKIHNELPMK